MDSNLSKTIWSPVLGYPDWKNVRIAGAKFVQVSVRIRAPENASQNSIVLRVRFLDEQGCEIDFRPPGFGYSERAGVYIYPRIKGERLIRTEVPVPGHARTFSVALQQWKSVSNGGFIHTNIRIKSIGGKRTRVRAGGPTFEIAETFHRPSEVRPADLLGKVFRVWVGRTPFDCLFNYRPGATRLYVMLHGAVKRDVHTPPIFSRWKWADTFHDGHQLCVSDPTLLLDDHVNLGWYMGSHEVEVIPGLLSVVTAFADRLRVQADVVFYGSSGGGFAAIAAAFRLPNGKAIAINPQIEPADYRPGARTARLFVESGDPAEARRRYPLRWSAIEVINDALVSGRRPRLVVAQNTADTEHLEYHFKRLCAQYETSQWLTTVLFTDPAGHAGETREMCQQLIAMI